MTQSAPLVHLLPNANPASLLSIFLTLPALARAPLALSRTMGHAKVAQPIALLVRVLLLV